MKNIGPIAFIVGVLIALIVGAFQMGDVGLYVLIVLGIVVGLLNIQPDEIVKYMVSIVALLFSAAELNKLFAVLPGGQVLIGILNALTAFLAAGAAIVALKTLLELARD